MQEAAADDLHHAAGLDHHLRRLRSRLRSEKQEGLHGAGHGAADHLGQMFTTARGADTSGPTKNSVSCVRAKHIAS